MHCHKPHPMEALSFPASELAPATLEFHTAICVTNVPITAKPTQNPPFPQPDRAPPPLLASLAF